MALERLFITCGGTGGHFYPGLAIAHEFKDRNGKVLLLLSGVNAENQANIARSQGIEAEILPFMPHPKKNPFKFITGLLGGIRQTRKLVKKHAPQAMLGMGSFASLPAILGTKTTGIPLFLHDGNARVGRANRIFSGMAKLIATAFPCVNESAVKAPLTVIGMPIRKALIEAGNIDKSSAVNELNQLFGCQLDASRKTILVFGGSQGADVFNKLFPQTFTELDRDDFQVLHLTGKGKLDAPQKIYSKAKFPHLLLESSEKMELFLAAADLAACRSGGSSLSELALFGLPAILIPLPSSAEGHQTDNARYFADNNAAVMLDGRSVTQNDIKSLINGFINEEENWLKMPQNMALLARPQASEDMLKLIQNAL